MRKSKRNKSLKKKVAANSGHMPGRHISIDDLQVLSRTLNVEPCGWNRKTKYDGELFYGTCAIDNFKPCNYPCTLPSWRYKSKYEGFECPNYKQFMRKQR